MQRYVVLNASNKTQHIPGIPPIGPGETVSGYVSNVVIDPHYRKLAGLAPLTGLAIAGTQNEYAFPAFLGLFATPFQFYNTEGALTTAARTHVLVSNSSDRELELPLVSEIPAGDILFVMSDLRLSALETTVVVNTGGADTIDGSAGPRILAGTAPTNALRFVSDGVSDWTTY